MKKTLKAIIAATGAAIMCAAPVLTSVSSTPIVNNLSASAAVYVNAFDSFDNSWIPSITVYDFKATINVGHVNYKLDKNTKTASIVGMDIQDSRIKFPAGINVNGTLFKTTSIASGAFQKKDGQRLSNGGSAPKGAALTMVDLNAAIYLKEIGNDAFDGCTKLTGSIRLPKSLTTIGQHAFRNTAITEVAYTVEDRKPVSSLKTVGNEAFMNCTSLTKIYLPATINTVGTKAFYNSGITLVNFAGPNSSPVTINGEAFSKCTKLNSIGTDRTVSTSSSRNAFSNSASGLKSKVHKYSSSTSDSVINQFKNFFSF